MKPFRIVITGASRPGVWYADKLGQEFEVVNREHTRHDGVFFRVRNDSEPFGIGFVLWDDCELAPQPAAEPVSDEHAELKSMVLERFGSMLENQMAFGVVVFNGVHVPTLKLIFDEFASATARANQADELRVELESAQSKLAQLRRVAEAAEVWIEHLLYSHPWEVGLGESKGEEFNSALKAWKAGKQAVRDD